MCPERKRRKRLSENKARNQDVSVSADEVYTGSSISNQVAWGFPPCLLLSARACEPSLFSPHLLHASSSLISVSLVPSKDTQNHGHETVGLEMTFVKFSGFYAVFASTPGAPSGKGLLNQQGSVIPRSHPDSPLPRLHQKSLL